MWKTGKTRTSTHQWAQLKQWAKNNLPYQCTQCGKTQHLELDHINPVAEGGQDDTHNVQWLCTTCHKRKTYYETRRGIKRKQQQRKRPDKYRDMHPGLLR